MKRLISEIRPTRYWFGMGFKREDYGRIEKNRAAIEWQEAES